MNTVQAYFLSDERQNSQLAKKLMDELLLSPMKEYNDLKNILKAAAFSRVGNASSIQMLLRFTLLLGRVQEALAQEQILGPEDLSRKNRLQVLEKLLLCGIRHHRNECGKSQQLAVLKWRRPAFELVELMKSLFLIQAVTQMDGQPEGECALIVRFCHLLGMDISESTVRNLRCTASGSIRQDAIFKQMGVAFRKWLHAGPGERSSGLTLKNDCSA